VLREMLVKPGQPLTWEDDLPYTSTRAPRTLRKLVDEATAHVAANAGSGGYLEFIYRHLGQLDKVAEVTYERQRNDDFHSTSLQLGDRTVRFARAYGFRNVQKIANAIKRGDCPYDFVEIMACPSGGCVNGGGQLQLPEKYAKVPERDLLSRDAVKRRALRVDATLHHHSRNAPDPHAQTNNRIRDPFNSLYLRASTADKDGDLVMQDAATATVRRVKPEIEPWLHTRFHNIPKLEDTLNPGLAKW